MLKKPDMPGEIFSGQPTSEDLIAILYEDLRRIARRERWVAGSPNTLQTTAILHEAYLRLRERAIWQSREHFLGVAATAMRYILVDAARARLAAKRGSGGSKLPLEAAHNVPAETPSDEQVVRLGDALRDLAALDPQLSQLVDCRFFAGLDEMETARLMGVSDRTVRRWWVQAKAWIHRELETA
ncbi:MAG: ECF-type sigma factor [Sphingomonas bacterium]